MSNSILSIDDNGESKKELVVNELKELEKEDLLSALSGNHKKSKKITKLKEKIDGLSGLEQENFKVDNISDWKEIISPRGEKYLENPEKDIIDYNGMQFFTLAAAIRETKASGKHMPHSYKSYENLIKRKYKGKHLLDRKGKIQEFFKGENIQLPGIRFPGDAEPLMEMGDEFMFWCEDGSNFGGNNERLRWNYHNDVWLFQIRCIKN